MTTIRITPVRPSFVRVAGLPVPGAGLGPTAAGDGLEPTADPGLGDVSPAEVV
jgi:hypothetical protein